MQDAHLNATRHGLSHIMALDDWTLASYDIGHDLPYGRMLCHGGPFIAHVALVHWGRLEYCEQL
jgi:hypothetical protein